MNYLGMHPLIMNQSLMNTPGIHTLIPNPPKLDINNAYPPTISQPARNIPEINQITTPLTNISIGASAQSTLSTTLNSMDTPAILTLVNNVAENSQSFIDNSINNTVMNVPGIKTIEQA